MRSRGKGFDWTPEEDATLSRLWVDERKSAGEIMLSAFPGHSRSAIIGRVTRLGLVRVLSCDDIKIREPRPPRAERRPSRPRTIVRFGSLGLQSQNPKVKPPSLPKPAPVPVKCESEPVTLSERRPDQCGWPVNDGAPYLFCGAGKSGHKRYCAHHAGASVRSGRAG